MKACILLSVLLCSLVPFSFAQVIVSGRIFKKGTNEVLFPVNVTNNRKSVFNASDKGGNYKLNVRKGDTIIFTYLGFYPQKLVVKQNSGQIHKDIFMVPKTELLPPVDISSLTPYQLDSLDRLRYFKYYLDKPVYHLMNMQSHSVKGKGGFGLVFSPLTYFSKEESRKRHFHKMYKQYEKDAFIDSRFTMQLVHRLTGLSDDSLAFFMNSHRPDYQFTRISDSLHFESWIIKQYEAYLQKIRKDNAKNTDR